MKYTRPGEDKIIQPRPGSALRPCPICGERVHARMLKCRVCDIVMHPEWEQAYDAGPPPLCRDCARRLGLREHRV